jgi:hypothetical protein
VGYSRSRLARRAEPELYAKDGRSVLSSDSAAEDNGSYNAQYLREKYSEPLHARIPLQAVESACLLSLPAAEGEHFRSPADPLRQRTLQRAKLAA